MGRSDGRRVGLTGHGRGQYAPGILRTTATQEASVALASIVRSRSRAAVPRRPDADPGGRLGAARGERGRARADRSRRRSPTPDAEPDTRRPTPTPTPTPVPTPDPDARPDARSDARPDADPDARPDGSDHPRRRASRSTAAATATASGCRSTAPRAARSPARTRRRSSPTTTRARRLGSIAATTQIRVLVLSHWGATPTVPLRIYGRMTAWSIDGIAKTFPIDSMLRVTPTTTTTSSGVAHDVADPGQRPDRHDPPRRPEAGHARRARRDRLAAGCSSTRSPARTTSTAASCGSSPRRSRRP